MQNLLLLFFGWVRAILYAVVLFMLAMSVCTVMYVIIVPMSFFNERLAIELYGRAAFVMWGAMQLIAEKFQGMHITFSGDEVPYGENAIVMANHQGFIDFYMIHAVLMRRGMLAYTKYFYKKSLNYIPFFGWGMRLMAFIPVSREWDKDKDTILSYFSDHLYYELPMCLVGFTEGTRLTEEKLAESQEYCRDKGLQELKYVMYPRVKGFVASVKGLRGSHVKHVYDMTIIYRNVDHPDKFKQNPSMATLHRGDATYRYHVHVQRFELASLPQDDEELKAWVVQRYVEKDQLIAKMYENWTPGRTEPFWGGAKRPFIAPGRYVWKPNHKSAEKTAKKKE